MEAYQQDREMYRRSTHRAIMMAVDELVQAALRGDNGDCAARQEHLSGVIKLGLQQTYRDALKRGCEMSMAAGRLALREFIKEHESDIPYGDICFMTRAHYKEDSE